MVARFHYDDSTYQQLLADELPLSEQEVISSHVETCDECQSKLESLSEAGISWDDVRHFLNSTPTQTADQELTQATSFSAAAYPARALNFLQSTTHPDSIGRFGRYEIKEILGRGGMGLVMRGYDPALERHSAIKVLAPEFAAHAPARQRFSREAKSAAAVVHEHVVPIQTVDEVEGLPYLVMPVIEGTSLEKRIGDNGPLELLEILRIGMQTASGLAAAHEQGLVHRDVKPANILLENSVERVMITDFGLARAADDASMTRSGVIAGTPQFMSPEQARGGDIDHRSDLFSLGSVLYSMCTGHSPFRAETTMGILHRIVNDDPRSIRTLNPQIPAWLEQIIFRLLAKDVDKRFSNAGEVADLLGRWLAHLQQPDKFPCPVFEFPRRANGWRENGWIKKLIVGSMGVIALTVATVLIVLETGKGTISIEADADSVPIRIMKGNKVFDRLQVTQGKASIRIAAGEYVIEVDGEDLGLKISDGEITLTRGGKALVHVVEKKSDPSTPAPERGKPSGEPIVGNTEKIQIAFSGLTGGTIMCRHADGDPNLLRNSLDEHVQVGKLPCRLDMSGGRKHHVEFKNVPGFARLAVYADIDLRPITDKTRAYLTHSALPIEFKHRQFEQAEDGAVLATVYYVDDSVESLSRKEVRTLTGDNVVSLTREAENLGTVLATVQIHRDLILKADKTTPLLEAVKRFNEIQRTNQPDHGQPPLTDEEVVAAVRYALVTPSPTLTQNQIYGLKLVAEHHMPKNWLIAGGPTKFGDADEAIDGWLIVLADTQAEDGESFVIRRRLLNPPASFARVETAEELPESMPLGAAIAAFNASHNSVDGKPQPLLTEDEVVAAILDWKHRRNDAPVVNRDFARFQEIAKTGSLPADVGIELISSFYPGDGANYSIWSVRIRMPKTGQKGWTYAYTIRRQYITSNSPKASDIRWGPAGNKGVQAGVRFSPASDVYAVGQVIKLEFFYRTVTGEKVPATLPNSFTHIALEVVDSAGNPYEVIDNAGSEIGGWIAGTIGELPVSRRGVPMVIRAEKPEESLIDDIAKLLGNREPITVIAQHGDSCRVRFKVSNYAEDSKRANLSTGIVSFKVAR